ncbi:hypothetical protein BC938DRAFT_483692 [Jimgerdemannia flammicorona]|uniref:Uncharacterized protein n=1 Tax=Jimgerdemannia flammicorona TaxID=994334 RepID=A0A433QBK9_9FUNG|nr:hypothetical protein BC938DRAFT_483692 [Jimgerdemannia flammicorona]
MADQQHDDDELAPSQTAGYKPGEKKSIQEYQTLDANDESLQKWKASLGLGQGSGPSDDPRRPYLFTRLTNNFNLAYPIIYVIDLHTGRHLPDCPGGRWPLGRRSGPLYASILATCKLLNPYPSWSEPHVHLAQRIILCRLHVLETQIHFLSQPSLPFLVTTVKDKPFTIKEGVEYRMKVLFKIQHDVVSGLKYLQVVKRRGIRGMFCAAQPLLCDGYFTYPKVSM